MNLHVNPNQIELNPKYSKIGWFGNYVNFDWSYLIKDDVRDGWNQSGRQALKRLKQAKHKRGTTQLGLVDSIFDFVKTTTKPPTKMLLVLGRRSVTDCFWMHQEQTSKFWSGRRRRNWRNFGKECRNILVIRVASCRSNSTSIFIPKWNFCWTFELKFMRRLQYALMNVAWARAFQACNLKRVWNQTIESGALAEGSWCIITIIIIGKNWILNLGTLLREFVDDFSFQVQ